MSSPTQKRQREDNEDEEQKPTKHVKLHDGPDRPDEEDAHQQQGGPPPPPPPPPPQCGICINDLYGPGQPPTISLVCLPNQVPHEFHQPCLQDWVYNAGFVPQETIAQGITVYTYQPPRCPLCRTRFVAAKYWPEYAALDNYPDAGYAQNAPAPDFDDESTSENEDSQGGDAGNAADWQYPYTTAQDLLDDDSIVPYEIYGEGDEYAQNQPPPQAPVPDADATFLCSQCNVDGGHDEMESAAFVANYGAGYVCHVCGQPVQAADNEPVLRCRNCGAPSHYHDQ